MSPIPRRTAVARLCATADAALGWLAELDWLGDAADHQAVRRLGAPSVDAVEDKVVAEIATLLHVADRVPDEEVQRAMVPLREAIARRARPERHLTLLRRLPHCVWPVGLAHAILTAQGDIDEQYEALISACLDTGWNADVERLPFRTLEARWAHSIRTGSPPRVADLVPSAGRDLLPPFLARREDGYALTHTVFYATDFGRFGSGVIDATALARVVDGYLADRLWADDMDLVGELALAALCAAAPCRYLTTALWVLFGDWADVVRGPGVSAPDSLSRLDRFTSCYHSTLVGALVAAALLILPYPGSSGVPDPARVERAALRILRRVARPDELCAAWTTLVDSAPDDAARVIATVEDGALSTACRDVRGTGLQFLLSGVDYDDPANTLTARQALDWLEIACNGSRRRERTPELAYSAGSIP